MEAKYATVAQIYARSSVLADWKEKAEFRDMSRDELIKLIQRSFTLAGQQGPLALMNSILTAGIIPNDFNMPIDDRDKMRLVVLECLRMRPSVNASTIVLKKPYSCPYKHGNKQPVIFPPNTPICINLALHGQDPSVYKDPTKFDPYGRREQLWGPNARYTLFNGVGDSGPRLCPGRDVALEILITSLQTIFSLTGGMDGNAADADKVPTIRNEIILESTVDAMAFMSNISNFFSSRQHPSDKWLMQIDSVVRAWAYLAIVSVEASNSVTRTAKDIHVFNPKGLLRSQPEIIGDPSNNVDEKIVIRFAKSDEEKGPLGCNVNMSAILNTMVSWKESNYSKLLFFPSKEEGAAVCNDRYKSVLPTSEVVWKELESDEAFSTLIFSGEIFVCDGNMLRCTCLRESIVIADATLVITSSVTLAHHFCCDIRMGFALMSFPSLTLSSHHLFLTTISLAQVSACNTSVAQVSKKAQNKRQSGTWPHTTCWTCQHCTSTTLGKNTNDTERRRTLT